MPFVKTQLEMTSEFYLDKLIVSRWTVALPVFLTSINYSLLFKKTGRLCMGLGWSGGPIALDLTYNYQTWNCYKTMLADRGKWESAWLGGDAKYID